MYDEFISRVQDRSRLRTLGEVVGTIHATLETLAERLTDDEAKDIASQLPREVAVYLLGSVLIEPDRMSLDEFLSRVMRREEMNPPNAIEPGTRIGRHYLRKVTEIFPNVRFEIERYIDAGDDVVVIAKQFGRGSSSGVETETRQGYVWTVAEGKATRFRWFNDPSEALEAVGLSEQDAHADS